MADEMKERLEKRRDERLLEIEKKRNKKADQLREEEDPKYILLKFTREKEKIKEILQNCNGLQQCTLQERLDEATKQTQKLQLFFTDSFAFLPPYDTKNMQAEIKDLQRDLHDKKTSLVPKKKFAFSKKHEVVNKSITTENRQVELHLILYINIEKMSEESIVA